MCCAVYAVCCVLRAACCACACVRVRARACACVLWWLMDGGGVCVVVDGVGGRAARHLDEELIARNHPGA